MKKDENKTFDFLTAMKYALDDKRVRCVTWDSTYYCTFSGGLYHLTDFSSSYVDDRGSTQLTKSDIISDWELYK